MNKSSKNNNNGNARRVPKTKKNSKPKRERVRRQDSRSVQVPVAQGKVSTMGRPQTRNLDNGDIIVTHREYIGEIVGSDLFAAISYPINPGLAKTFPWLSGIASNWESYLFSDLEFMIETQASTVTQGTIISALDYDPNDPAPVSKIQAMAYRGSVRTPTWSSSRHKSLKEDLNKRKTYFVRNGVLQQNQEVNTFDVGNFYVCTQGQAGAADLDIAELYVSYTVKLITPQIGNPAVGNAIFGRGTGNNTGLKFSNLTGNLPVTVVNPDADSTTWTFSSAWEGYMTITITGTVLIPVTLLASNGVTVVIVTSIVDAGGLNSCSLLTITTNTGGDFTLNVGNASLSASLAAFGQANVP